MGKGSVQFLLCSKHVTIPKLTCFSLNLGVRNPFFSSVFLLQKFPTFPFCGLQRGVSNIFNPSQSFLIQFFASILVRFILKSLLEKLLDALPFFYFLVDSHFLILFIGGSPGLPQALGLSLISICVLYSCGFS